MQVKKIVNYLLQNSERFSVWIQRNFLGYRFSTSLCWHVGTLGEEQCLFPTQQAFKILYGPCLDINHNRRLNFFDWIQWLKN
jgi:hypothetical protein